MPQALEGIKVLDWSQMVAGPYCAKLLADLGAETIKIEPPGRGDEARAKPPSCPALGKGNSQCSGLFLFLNTSKQGVTLNAEVPQGQELFRKLIAWADVLIEDHPPQKLASLGLDYPSLKKINPGLIMASITPFGQTGPYRDFKAYPLNTFHSGGEGFTLPAGTAFPHRPPVKSANYSGEYQVGINTAGAILAAVYHREESGVGQHIDISKQEILLYLSAPELQDFPQWGMITDRLTRSFNFPGQFPCRDGYIHVTLMGRAHRAAFFELVGYPDWQKEEKLLSRRYLDEHGDEVAEKVKEQLQQRTKQDICSSPQARECPMGPYLNPAEVVNSPQMQARGFFEEIDHPETGPASYPSAPYRFSRTPRQVGQPAPRLGQHNEEVFGRLGCSPPELQQLKERGAI